LLTNPLQLPQLIAPGAWPLPRVNGIDQDLVALRMSEMLRKMKLSGVVARAACEPIGIGATIERVIAGATVERKK